MSQNEPVMSQRDRFEHWFSDQGKWPQAIERSGEGYVLMQAQDAWQAWKAACPEGWQTVPVEATEEMQARVPLTSAPDYVWKVMLAAAPKPPC